MGLEYALQTRQCAKLQGNLNSDSQDADYTSLEYFFTGVTRWCEGF